jgi:hypothetical protein
MDRRIVASLKRTLAIRRSIRDVVVYEFDLVVAMVVGFFAAGIVTT